jgi:hypothetical protein
MKCIECGTEVPSARGAKSKFLCERCRKALSFTCIECGTEIFNTDNQKPSFFLTRSVCSEDCRRQRIRKAKLASNPMKDKDVVQRMKQTRLERYQGKSLRSPMSKEERQRISDRMKQQNPMQDPLIAYKQGQIQRERHAANRSLWKERYREAKFSHFVAIAEAEEEGAIGPQRSGANPIATAFFRTLVEAMQWEEDEMYYDGSPYEFPLIISKAAKICYFPDFYNRTKGIVVEWDERAHKYGRRATKDKRRDSQIKKKYPEIIIIRLAEDIVDKIAYVREKI